MTCALTLPTAQRDLPRQADLQIDTWLSAQQRLVEHWIDQLVAENGNLQLVAVLEQHRHFLAEAQHMVLGSR